MKSGGGMLMKTHLAQEMSKEAGFLQEPPGIIAKLMGLDAMSARQPVLAANKSWHESYPNNASTRASMDSQDFEDCYFSSPLPLGIPSFAQEHKRKDVFVIRKQQPSVKHWINEVSPTRKSRSIDCSDDWRMAMVRQKFIEAKRLALDEKLMQSKEFQDALEILSSNKDLLLKFLEEPNSLFSKHLNEFHSTIPQSQTRRITVLQPPKSWSPKGETLTKQQHSAAGELGQDALNLGRLPSSLGFSKDENPTQPTRIVVLKPGLVKPHSSGNSSGLDTPSSTKPLDERDFSKAYETDEAIGSRQMAKEITRNTWESSSYIGFDSISSSVLSNGYVGDESSFNRSENEHVAAEEGNSSGSDNAIPSSRHSWSHSSRYAASPFSVSPASWASHSPESSVTKEAKKRLSERLAVVTFRGVNQETENVRSSSTLGEMLAMPEIKNDEGKENIVSSSMKAGGSDENYWSYLLRSKSSPVSSSNDDTMASMAEVPGSPTRKPIPLKEIAIATPKSSKTSWKLSRLFFPKSKKSKKPIPPDGGLCAVAESSGEDHEGGSHDDISSVYSGRLAASPTTLAAMPSKAALALDRAYSSESLSDYKEQPSLASLLEAQFQDDTNRCGQEASHVLDPGHLQAVSRSPPIGSLARSLSWESHETNPNAWTSNSWKHSVSSTKAVAAAAAAEEEQERFLFVHKLLSSAGTTKWIQALEAFSRWHSPDTPLDPALLQESFGGSEEGAKCSSEMRCHQRLLFDCVNEALLEMGLAAISGSNGSACAFRCSRPCSTALARGDEPDRHSVPEGVCGLLKGWFSGAGGQRLPGHGADGAANGAVGWVVRREVVGREWKESLWREVDEISKEIGTKVLEELVGDALKDLTTLSF